MVSPERNSYIEKTIEESRMLLRDPVISKILGPHAAMLDGRLDQLFVPNIRGGRVQIPAEYDNEDSYPILAVAPDEAVIIPHLNPTPEQKRSMLHEMRVLEPIGIEPERMLELTLQQVLAQKEAGSYSVPSFASASTVQILSVIRSSIKGLFANPPSNALRVSARPAVMLNYAADSNQHFAPDSLPHELVHIDQCVNRSLSAVPVDIRREELSDELESYFVSAKIYVGGSVYGSQQPQVMRAIDDETASVSVMVEEIRGRHVQPGEPPFEPTDSMIRELADRGLLADILPPKPELTRLGRFISFFDKRP